MSQIIRPPNWSQFSTNLTGTPSQAAPGTAVTAGANNADGTAVTLISALAHDIEYLVIGAGGFNASNEDVSTLLDILVDPAGGTSWSSFIDDLLVGYTGAITSTSGRQREYHFPVWLKAGTSIGARARSARASTIAGRVIAYGMGGNANPASWWAGRSVTTFGANAAASKGTLHTPGNSGAYSSWANVGSPAPAPIGAMQMGVQGSGAVTAMTAIGYYWRYGVGGVQIGPPHYVANSTLEVSAMVHPGVQFCGIPSGAQLQVQATASGVAQEIDVALYGVH